MAKESLTKKVKGLLYDYAYGEELCRLYMKFEPENTKKDEELMIMFYYKKVALKELVSDRYSDDIISDAVWDARKRIAEKYNIEEIYRYDWNNFNYKW